MSFDLFDVNIHPSEREAFRLWWLQETAWMAQGDPWTLLGRKTEDQQLDIIRKFLQHQAVASSYVVPDNRGEGVRLCPDCDLFHSAEISCDQLSDQRFAAIERHEWMRERDKRLGIVDRADWMLA